MLHIGAKLEDALQLIHTLHVIESLAIAQLVQIVHASKGGVPDAAHEWAKVPACLHHHVVAVLVVHLAELL